MSCDIYLIPILNAITGTPERSEKRRTGGGGGKKREENTTDKSVLVAPKPRAKQVTPPTLGGSTGFRKASDDSPLYLNKRAS